MARRVDLQEYLRNTRELLVFCLDGHEAEIPDLDDAVLERAQEAVQAGKSLSSGEPARFPRAAGAVLEALSTLREAGVYPRPKLT